MCCVLDKFSKVYKYNLSNEYIIGIVKREDIVIRVYENFVRIFKKFDITCITESL